MIVQIYLQDKFLKVEMPGQRVPTFIILRSTAKLLFMGGNARVRHSQWTRAHFPIPMAKIVSCQTCDFSQSDRSKTISQCNVILLFLFMNEL